jgi:hypothetical protein
VQTKTGESVICEGSPPSNNSNTSMVYDGNQNVYFIGGCAKNFDRLNLSDMSWKKLPDAL